MKATCHFLNVGQGMSQVIEIGQQKAIVVDTGSQSGQHSPLLKLLAEREIQKIEVLILSHNDTDHIGGVVSLLRKYSKQIEYIGFLTDRGNNDKFIQTIKKYYPSDSKIRLEVDAPNLSKDIFKNNSVPICVKVLFPTFSENIQYEKNETCAVVMLIVGTQKVIFSGDASILAWRSIVNRNENRQIVANILTVPHHGGRFTSVPPSHCDFQKQLVEFHTQLVKTNYAVASFASHNKYRHPISEVIRSFAQNKVEIFCIQKAEECDEGTSGDCCGTIIADIGTDETKIRNHEELKRRKEERKSRLCCVYTEHSI
ncbi:MAG: MBL fold metallo-hydrolase [Planctomycetaceae bacterium]|jgi:competence protein ComEC|nr:MBL fold metallo-hydrolase [Planctomycetaceae bacterium]